MPIAIHTAFYALILMFAMPSLAASQTEPQFSISSAGELDLDSNQIVNSGYVSRYLGFFVSGSGEGSIVVSIGDESASKSYTFQLSSTRFVSFLFDGVLAEEIALAFRRGVFGAISISILDSQGVTSDSTTINLEVTRKKSSCKKYTSPKLKRCARIDLSKASRRERKTLTRKLLSSIRGPIVLEP